MGLLQDPAVARNFPATSVQRISVLGQGKGGRHRSCRERREECERRGRSQQKREEKWNLRSCYQRLEILR